jgi:hypothetical protein
MKPRAGLVWIVLASVPAGCGGRGAYRLAPVSGKVTLNGRPLADATVEFVPAAGAPADAPLPSSVGTTGEDGRYSLVLADRDKTPGGVVGKHRVIITLGGQGGAKEGRPTFHRQLPERYNRKTELGCVVPEDGREDANFELKSP